MAIGKYHFIIASLICKRKQGIKFDVCRAETKTYKNC